ncbi:GGDEF domain-containing protein [Motilibacter peucedani]|uniref:GGDEF domain-containing protein n=1 Tax=Motilibacter peucedani TaxID=598650 RepID=UPI000EB1F264|nr:GGDEF domain-containing protein [Motilibacter peucedani]
MSGIWSDELVRLRTGAHDAVRRVPGGAVAVLCAALTLVTVVAGGLAVAVPSAAPLVVVPVAVAASALLPPSRPRVLLALLCGLAAATALAELGLWLRDARTVGGTLALAAAYAMAGALSLVLGARERTLRLALEVSRAAVDAVSVKDPLTGVANRHGLDLLGRQVVETARRQGDAAHCTFVEIGGLAEARVSHGPEAVADVLVALAEAIKGVTRTTDVVARWKDPVFCVVGQGAGMDPAELERRVRKQLGADAALDRSVWSGRITVGGAMLPPWDAGTLETLVVRAAEELRARTSVRRPAVGSPVPRHDPAT